MQTLRGDGNLHREFSGLQRDRPLCPAAATAEDMTYPDYSSPGRSGIAEAKELSEAAKDFEVDAETIVDVGEDGRLDRSKAEEKGGEVGQSPRRGAEVRAGNNTRTLTVESGEIWRGKKPRRRLSPP